MSEFTYCDSEEIENEDVVEVKNVIELSYTTKLETITEQTDVKAILDAKLEATSPSKVVDYVALAADHIEAKISEINSAVKSLNEMKKHEQARLELIKEQACEWLEDTGLDRLDGLIVSSMTINNTKPKEELIIDNEEALLNGGYFKTVVDTKKAKDDLIAGIEVEGAHIEVTHVANKIKINKKQ